MKDDGITPDVLILFTQSSVRRQRYADLCLYNRLYGAVRIILKVLNPNGTAIAAALLVANGPAAVMICRLLPIAPSTYYEAIARRNDVSRLKACPSRGFTYDTA